MKIKMPSTLRARVAVGVLGVGLILLAASAWVVPRIIEGQVGGMIDGRVRVGGWWADRSSAGVSGLLLYEGHSASSPIWARVDRVETDLSLGRLVFGSRSPSRVTLVRPVLTLRIGKDGKPLTAPAFRGGGSSGKTSAAPQPRIVVEDATIKLQQEGRPEMVVTGVSGQVFGQDGKQVIDFGVEDPTWGKWSASGKLGGDFASGRVVLRTLAPIEVTDAKTAQLPFIPAEVWKNVAARGRVGVDLALSPGKALGVVTALTLDDATVILPDLGLTATGTTGRVVVADGVVKLENLRGHALDGTLAAAGTFDFTKSPARAAINLDLAGVDVTKTPKSWQLDEAGVTGRLTGTARLKVALKPEGADLTGTEGDAVIEGGTIEGIAAKAMKLGMKAEGRDFQYETKASSGASLRKALVPLVFVALQQQPAPPKKGGLILPKFLSTEIELEDVDLLQVVAKAQAMGIKIPVAMTGKLSIKAKAKIPIGALKDIKGYSFHGQATLKGAVIDGVDLGLLRARVDLENGVLDLNDFQGRLLDRPAGSRDDPAPPAEPVAADAPLPPGGFRGHLHAEIDPPGKLEGHFEAHLLPVGELAAPFFPKPTPVSGAVSLEVTAKADLSKLGDADGWDVSGQAHGSQVRYRGSALDAFSSTFAIQKGRLRVPVLSASLEGQPLSGSIDAGLTAPYDFQAQLDTTNWDLSALLALVPSAPKPAPAAGIITVHARAKGTLSPQEITSEGEGRLAGFRVGPVPLGDVPIQWSTQGDAIVVSILEAQPFGGKIAARASLPVKGDRPITATLQARGVDTAMLSAAVPNGSLQLAGKADGDASLTIRPLAGDKAPVVDASLKLDSPDLTIQGLAARDVQAAVKVVGGALRFDLFAESLGGKVKFSGEVPLGAASGPHRPEANASLKAVGFRVEDLWRPLGLQGMAAGVEGVGAIDVNLRTHRDVIDVRARGVAELRDLRWGRHVPLGDLKGTFTLSPDGLTVAPITGDVFGGTLRGALRSTGQAPRVVGFDVEAEHVSIHRVLGLVPKLARHVEGFGSLRLSGRFSNGLRADGEVAVTSARLFGFPLSDLHAPVTLEFAPGGPGTLGLRRWTARVAGGRLTGDAHVGLGHSHSFQVDTQLNGIDLETLGRLLSDAKKPAAGKVSGKISVGSGDASALGRYRGRIDLDLDDASLVELPLFRELDRFLGAARGGIFEDGDVHAAIAGGQVVVESFTLVGPLVQLHGSGTVGFDTRLDLQVLVNTTLIIAQTGDALAALIPGMSGAGNRQETARFANFLSNRLLKFRVTGTLANPSVNLDPTIAVTEGAAGFFAGALKLPAGLLR